MIFIIRKALKLQIIENFLTISLFWLSFYAIALIIIGGIQY